MDTTFGIGLNRQTKTFPAFWLRESEFTIDWSVDSATEIAAVMFAQDLIGEGGGIVVANPVPEHLGWEKTEHDLIVAKAFAAADAAGVRGKAVTPFLLQYIVEASGGKSLEVNLNLAKNNVSLAADIAIAWSAISED